MVPHTFSTAGVNRISYPLKYKEIPGKRDPGDHDLYRRYVKAPDLVRFAVVVKETNLLVLAGEELSERVRDLVITARYHLEAWIHDHPGFRESFVPVPVPETAPPIVRLMADAGRAAGVGPMAAVAGAVSETVASGLALPDRELIIENGGDVYLSSRRERTVGIWTGEGGRDLSLGIRIEPGMTPVGICTSSGRIGHSISLGESAAATVIAPSAALADAAATAVGNRVRGADGVRAGLEAAQGIPGIIGAVVVRSGEVGVWGKVELVGV
jgi:ApbE superfamily uncharacterized protein (UPF0280 family)